MDVVNELQMGPPAITSLGGSEEVNSSQKQKKARKKNKQGNAVECEGPDFSLDNSSPETGATTKHPSHESPALPALLSSHTDVEFHSTNKNDKRKRQKTKHNAIESNANGCVAPDNTFSSKISTPALDVPSELPIQCVSPDSVIRQSCMEEGICEGHNEEKEQNMINKTAENKNGQFGHNEGKEEHMINKTSENSNGLCELQEASCNNFLGVASPELFAKENVLEVVRLNIEQGVYDNSSNSANKSGFVNNTSLVMKNDDDPAVYDISDKNQYVKTYSRRRNFDCRRNSGYYENCDKESSMQDHHKYDSYKFSDGPLTVGLIDRETKHSSDLVTSQSGAAAEEMKLRTENTNEQRFMATSSVVDVPVEQHETNGRQLDHTEITRNDLCCAGDVSDLSLVTVKDGHSKISQFSLDRTVASNSKNKLLILDVNGLLADFVSDTDTPRRYKYRPEPEPDFWLKRRKVYKRPFCDDFLQFCFDRFHVGVWSSRTKRNVDEAIKFLIGKSASKLLFCWNQSHCTMTQFTTVENRSKPLVLKELRKLWEKVEPDLPWEKGEFNESNTLLLDDSPYKALVNPKHTAIFPYSYRYFDYRDSSLGPGGDLRIYLEGLAKADNVQEYVAANPFGQRPIRETNPSWGYYRKVIASVKNSQNARPSSPGREPTAHRAVHDELC